MARTDNLLQIKTQKWIAKNISNRSVVIGDLRIPAIVAGGACDLLQFVTKQQVSLSADLNYSLKHNLIVIDKYTSIGDTSPDVANNTNADTAVTSPTGIISGGSSSVAIATTSSTGVVQPDGTSITIDANGIISATGLIDELVVAIEPAVLQVGKINSLQSAGSYTLPNAAGLVNGTRLGAINDNSSGVTVTITGGAQNWTSNNNNSASGGATDCVVYFAFNNDWYYESTNVAPLVGSSSEMFTSTVLYSTDATFVASASTYYIIVGAFSPSNNIQIPLASANAGKYIGIERSVDNIAVPNNINIYSNLGDNIISQPRSGLALSNYGDRRILLSDGTYWIVVSESTDLHPQISGKMDKVQNPTAGNLIVQDSSGNAVDGGSLPSGGGSSNTYIVVDDLTEYAPSYPMISTDGDYLMDSNTAMNYGQSVIYPDYGVFNYAVGNWTTVKNPLATGDTVLNQKTILGGGTAAEEYVHIGGGAFKQLTNIDNVFPNGVKYIGGSGIDVITAGAINNITPSPGMEYNAMLPTATSFPIGQLMAIVNDSGPWNGTSVGTVTVNPTGTSVTTMANLGASNGIRDTIVLKNSGSLGWTIVSMSIGSKNGGLFKTFTDTTSDFTAESGSFYSAISNIADITFTFPLTSSNGDMFAVKNDKGSDNNVVYQYPSTIDTYKIMPGSCRYFFYDGITWKDISSSDGDIPFHLYQHPNNINFDAVAGVFYGALATSGDVSFTFPLTTSNGDTFAVKNNDDSTYNITYFDIDTGSTIAIKPGQCRYFSFDHIAMSWIDISANKYSLPVNAILLTKDTSNTSISMDGAAFSPPMDGGESVSIGFGSNGSSNGVAIGQNADGSSGVSIGRHANGSSGTAIGMNSNGNNGLAIGQNADGSNGGISIGNSVLSSNGGVTIASGGGVIPIGDPTKNARVEICGTGAMCPLNRFQMQSNGLTAFTIGTSITLPSAATVSDSTNADNTILSGMLGFSLSPTGNAIILSYNDNGTIKTASITLS